MGKVLEKRNKLTVVSAADESVKQNWDQREVNRDNYLRTTKKIVNRLR